MKRVNPWLICQAYEFDNSTYIPLFKGFIEYINKYRDYNRFAEQWYDLLCSCSTPKGRRTLDLTLLLIQLESMLLFLLNRNESRVLSQSLVDLRKEIRDTLGLSCGTTSSYMRGYEPIKIAQKSLAYYLEIAIALGEANRTLKYDGLYDLLTKDSSDLAAVIASVLFDTTEFKFTEIKKLCGSGQQFNMLMRIIDNHYSNNETCCNYAIDWRNDVAHEGQTKDIESKKCDQFIKYILSTALEIYARHLQVCKSQKKQRQTLLEWCHTIFASGKVLSNISRGMDWLRKAIGNLLNLRYVSIAAGVSFVLIFCYSYLIVGVPSVNFSTVPESKRIELYDKILTKSLTEGHVKQLQEELTKINDIEKQVKDYEASNR